MSVKSRLQKKAAFLLCLVNKEKVMPTLIKAIIKETKVLCGMGKDMQIFAKAIV